MIKLLGKVPPTVTVACSGGVDSMVLLDFLAKKHSVNVAFFDHGTEASRVARKFLTEECDRRNLPLSVGEIQKIHRSREFSPEEHWRIERYNFLAQFPVVVTAHHLDDVAETWIWSSLHGTSSIIPYSRGNVIRPLLLTRKSELEHWAKRKNVQWVEDASNSNTDYTRNYIRHKLMNHALCVNPGLHSMLRKKLEERGVDR